MRTVAVIGSRGYPSFYGGFETLVRQLAPFLAERGWMVTVYGRRAAASGSAQTMIDGVQVIDTRGLDNKSLSTLSFGLTSSWDALRKKPDVALVLNVANGFWLPLFKLRGIPTVVNVDGIEWDRQKWGRAAKAMFRMGARICALSATTLVYDAQAIANYWMKRYRKKGVVIPYGGTVVDSGDLKEEFKSGSYALAVARFVPENTMPEFLEAASRVARTHDVVIVGSSGYGGPLDDAVRRLSETHDRVHWLGHLRDDARLFALWQHAGVYFHGHSVGGTNPALVQAMACGAPTVARDTVYNREVLGAAGVFVPPNADRIADELVAMLESPETRGRLSAEARSRALRSYTWEQVCSAYEDALGNAIGLARENRSAEGHSGSGRMRSCLPRRKRDCKRFV